MALWRKIGGNYVSAKLVPLHAPKRPPDTAMTFCSGATAAKSWFLNKCKGCCKVTKKFPI